MTKTRIEIGFPYTDAMEEDMQMFYNSLNEKDQRHYAAIEAKKLYHGGITYISELFNCSRSVLYDGLEDLKKKELLKPTQIRKKGSGRKPAAFNYSNIDEVFLIVISDHIAGDPMNEDIRWVKLTRAEIKNEMESYNIKISRNIVKKLLKKHKFVKRKMQRKRSIGKSADREPQFQNIIKVKNDNLNSKNPIISMDTKKKELIGGNLHRQGSVYCTEAIQVSDHDYPHLADLKIAPHGIYDIKQNLAYINIGVSSETGEFICDSLEIWWTDYGQYLYPEAEEIITFCDAGGANCYRHHIFKYELQRLANKINMPIKIIHYPPYTSKWNPIEHRVFPHITRQLDGVPLNSIQEANDRIALTTTRTGLTVVTNIIDKVYETGKKLTEEVLKNIKITFGESVPHLNYTIFPMENCQM
jgi:transposase